MAGGVSALISTVSPQDARINAAREQATQLEGVFLNTLVKEMFSGIDTNTEFGGGQAEETWRSMQSEYLADSIARQGGIGLADDIMRVLLAQQNVPTETHTASSIEDVSQ